MKSIIVEGPDGAGKSTLVQYLSQTLDMPIHHRSSDSKTGPIDGLAQWVEDQIAWHVVTGDSTVYDRHPVISEPIYGPLVRKKYRKGFDDEGWLREARELLYISTVVVWCFPGSDTVSRNVTDTAHDQMPGVLANIGKVYTAYTTAYFRWRGPKRVYDYQVHNKFMIASELQRMIKE